jgi:hypothetical protein
MTVGYLAGDFDLINVRDLDVIAQASQYCSRLVVGVFSDEFAERHRGRRPIVPLVERMALVSHVRGVHSVVVHDDTTSLDSEVRCFRVAGEEPLGDDSDSWVLQSSRHTASAILQEALQPLRPAGQPLRRDQVA